MAKYDPYEYNIRPGFHDTYSEEEIEEMRREYYAAWAEAEIIAALNRDCGGQEAAHCANYDIGLIRAIASKPNVEIRQDEYEKAITACMEHNSKGEKSK